MRGNNLKTTRRITLCALFCGISVAIMYLGTLTNVLSLSSTAIAALLGVIVVIEYGGIWPWLVYTVTGTLALVLLPDKSCAVIYIAFVGYYPMLKQVLERLNRIISWVLKIVIFNIALAVTETISFFVLNMEFEGYLIEAALFVVGNIALLLFDIVLTRLITLYLHKYRQRFRFFR